MQEESCILCQEKLETLVHVFVQCPITEIIWANSRCLLRINRLNINSISQWVHVILNPCKYLGIKVEDEHAFILFAAVVCYQIWQLRNKVLHDNMIVNPIIVMRETNKVFENHWKAWNKHSLD